MRTRFTTLLITLLIIGSLAGLWPLKAQAYTFSGGNGDPGNPYLITTAADLYHVREKLSASYKLQADIDLSADYPNWEPIGTASDWFKGHFDGADFTISGLKINSNADNIGLFGVMRQPATIKNVRLENVDITLSDNYTANVGGLVGAVSSSSPYTALDRISVTGAIRAGNAFTAGGVVGNFSIAGLSNSDAHVRIEAGYTYTGGAVGYNSSGTIEQSYATGDVSSGRNTGGLVGIQTRDLLNSFAIGDVTSADHTTSTKIGGLIGQIKGGQSINNSYAAGLVRKGSGSQTGIQIGGLAGGLDGTGSVTITNSYWNSDDDNDGLQTKGWEPGIGGAISREALKQIVIADVGWDPDIWGIQTGASYPYLKSFSPVLRVDPFPPASIYATEPGYNQLTISGFVRDGSIGEPWEVSYTIKDDEDTTITQGDDAGIATAHNQTFSLTTTLDKSSYPLGTYTISITVKDTVVRPDQPQTLTFDIVDRTAPAAPTLTTPGNSQLTNEARPVVSGTAEAGATVTIVLDGSAAGTVMAGVYGSWTWTAGTDLTEGTHTVKVRAADGAGNVSADSAVHTFTVDRTAPAAPTLTTPGNGQLTNEARPTVSGTAEAGATVTIVLDGSAAGTTVAKVDGSWTWTAGTDLTEGTHTVKVRAADGAGNVSADSAVHTFTVDRTAPTAPTLTTPGNGQLTNEARPTVSGTAEAGATVTIVLDGSAAGTVMAGVYGSWTWTAGTDLTEGTHTVKVRAADGAGNVSADSAVHTFTVDRTAPLITLRGSTSVQVEAGTSYSEPGATAEDRVEGNITSRITVTGSVYPHQLGTYILEYRVTNQQGISASTVLRSVYVVDTQAPVITLLGDDNITLTEGDGFVDPGATAADSFEGDVRVAVTGVVDTQIPGTYYLRYNAQDSSDNAAVEVTRTVRVEAMVPSSPHSPGGAYGSGNASLKQIKVLAGDNELTLTPAFAAEITSYKAETTAERVDILVISSDENAVITLRGAAQHGAEAFALTLGDNQFEITVEAENGAIKTYSLTIHRQNETGTQTVPSESPPCVFTDIQGHWAALQICEAADKGIVEGVSATLFRPQGLVTRVEFAAMLLRAFEISTEREAVKFSFTDTDAIPVWAHDTVRDAVEAGLLEGYSDGTLRPNQTVSRSEMAVMLARVMKWNSVHTPKDTFADDAEIPEWARGYIYAAYQRGVLEGREGNQFIPYGEATRAEAAVVILRMLRI